MKRDSKRNPPRTLNDRDLRQVTGGTTAGDIIVVDGPMPQTKEHVLLG